MDPLTAKLEKRFSPEFSKLLAKRVRNTPNDLASRRRFSRFHTDKHPLNDHSTNQFTEANSVEHIRQTRGDILKHKP